MVSPIAQMYLLVRAEDAIVAGVAHVEDKKDQEHQSTNYAGGLNGRLQTPN